MRPRCLPCVWRTAASGVARTSESQANSGQPSRSWMYVIHCTPCGDYRQSSPNGLANGAKYAVNRPAIHRKPSSGQARIMYRTLLKRTVLKRGLSIGHRASEGRFLVNARSPDRLTWRSSRERVAFFDSTASGGLWRRSAARANATGGAGRALICFDWRWSVAGITPVAEQQQEVADTDDEVTVKVGDSRSGHVPAGEQQDEVADVHLAVIADVARTGTGE